MSEAEVRRLERLGRECPQDPVARAAAGEIGAHFCRVGPADILDVWIGAGEHNLADVFDTARRIHPWDIDPALLRREARRRARKLPPEAGPNVEADLKAEKKKRR